MYCSNKMAVAILLIRSLHCVISLFSLCLT